MPNAHSAVSLSELSAERTYAALLTHKASFTGENGYCIQQGAATDGTYGYFMQENPEKHDCALLKVDLQTWNIVDVRYALPVEHGNAMTHNPRTNRLIVAHCTPTENRLSFIDCDTLSVVGTLDMPITVMSVAYDPVSNRYAMGHKDRHTFSIVDGNFNVLASYPIRKGFRNNQDADCDEHFIYMLETDMDKSPINHITVYDWQGRYVTCIRIISPYEVESMLHIGERIILLIIMALRFTKPASLWINTAQTGTR